ncbi:hypothetical protein [[Mycoplasma] imitans]|uniref:hypothetical protein n=1 Tax=[Mycoplasma] imitans TaxID=29560 RepID=UPI000486CF1D|nr:hypothetical protein [[Mycoplasma] imitans]
MKIKKIAKSFLLGSLATLPLIGVSAGLINKQVSIPNTNFNLTNHSTSVVADTTNNQDQLQKWSNDLSQYKKIDNDQTLFLGKNYVRLNSTVVFNQEQRRLIQQTTVGVYDQLNNQLQAITLSNDFKHLYFVDNNDPTKGFVATDDLHNAIYYPIDLNTGLIDQEDAWAITTQKQASNVAAYLSTQGDDQSDLVKNARIVSFSVDNNQLKAVVYNQNGSFVVQNIPAINKAFSSIKIVKSFSINNALFTGINFYDDQNQLVGSQIINIKNGMYVPGGASFDINRQINAMVYDADHNAIYVQYYFINDNTTRMWYYSVSPIDQFGQIGTIPNENIFSDLIFIKGEGIVGINKQRSNLTLYPFEKDRILAAPTFKDVASSYTNDFFKKNSDKITNIVFDQKDQTFAVFYNSNIYTDGIVSFSLTDFKNKSDVYSDIVPIYIDEVKLIDEMNTAAYQKSFASVYAKAERTNDFDKFLVIPQFYKTLENQSKVNQDDHWNLSYSANENTGTISLSIKLLYQQKQLNLLDRNLIGFEQVNASDIKTHYNKNSTLLDKTPTEIRRLLDDPRTVQETKQAIFDLYGFDPKYKQLPYDVSIQDSSVLGNVTFIFKFLTIKDNSIQANFKKDGLVNQAAVLAPATTNNFLTFDESFKLSIERWFIPVVLIALIVFMLIVSALIYFLIIQRKYPKLLANIKQKLNPQVVDEPIEEEPKIVSINDHLLINQQKDEIDLTKPSKLKLINKFKDFKLKKAKAEADYFKTKEITIQHEEKTKPTQVNTKLTQQSSKKLATIDLFHKQMAKDQLSWNPEIKLTKEIQ